MKTPRFVLLAVVILCSAFEVAIAQTWTSRVLYPANYTLNSVVGFSNGLVIGVGNLGTIERSVDSGTTWSGSSESISNFNSVCSYDGARVVAVGDSGTVSVSIDSGKSWSPQRISVKDNVRSVTALPSQQYIAVGTHGFLAVSTNGGLTWRQRGIGEKDNMNDILCLANGSMFICGDGGLLLHGSVHDDAWSFVSSGTAENLRHFIIAPSGKLFAYGDNWALLSSTDSGVTWSRIALDTNTSNSPHAIVHDVFFVDSLHGTATLSDEATRLFASYSTIDGGMSWFKDTGFSFAGITSSCYLSDSLTVLVGSSEIKLIKGRSILTTPKPAVYYAMRFATADLGFIMRHRNVYEMERTSDRGNTWEIVDSPSDRVNDFAFASSTNIFAYGTQVLRHSIDGGKSWIALDGVAFGGIQAMDFTKDGYGAMLSDDPVLRITTDSGTTWQNILVPSSPRSFTCMSLLGRDSILLSARDTIYRTIDGGKHWKSTIMSHFVSAITFKEPVAWAVGQEIQGSNYLNAISRSVNSGETWANIAFDTSGVEHIALLQPADGNHAIMVRQSANRSRVFELSGDRTRWLFDSAATTTADSQYLAVSYPVNNVAYLLSSRGLLTRGVFDVASVYPPTIRPESPALLTCYPNPARSGLVLELPKELITIARIQIYDDAGAPVLRAQAQALGSRVTSLDISSLVPGNYFGTILIDGLLYSFKFSVR